MIETKIKGLALGCTQITSSKTGKIYYKFGFYADGSACSLMVGEQKGREIMKAPNLLKSSRRTSPSLAKLLLVWN